MKIAYGALTLGLSTAATTLSSIFLVPLILPATRRDDALYEWLVAGGVILLAVGCSVISFERGRRALRTTCAARMTITEAVRRGERVGVWGGGWSLILGAKSRGVVSTAGYRGEIERDVWRSGSTIDEIQATLAARGQTLAGVPSIATATLGGWIFSSSHGSGGALYTSTISDVHVYDFETREERVVQKKFFGADKSLEEQRRFLILGARVLPVPNVLVERQGFDVASVDDARRFLDPATRVRLIFITRGQTVAFTWRDATSTFRSPNLPFPPWFWSLLPPTWGARIDRRRFGAIESLRSANDFAPTPPVGGDAFAALFVNFEVFVERRVDAQLIHKVCQTLRSFFETAHGRCEVRCGARRLFLDFALPRTRCCAVEARRDVFVALSRALGSSTRVVLHKGKYQMDTAPLVRV